MIEMDVVGIRMELPTNQPIVLLKERNGPRHLPIWIGPAETRAISHGLQGAVPPRPMTHDLLREIIDNLGATLESVVITSLVEKIFCARLTLDQGGEKRVIEARTSDAIALATRCAAPIWCEDEVLAEAGIELSEETPEDTETEVERFREFLETVRPEDFA